MESVYNFYFENESIANFLLFIIGTFVAAQLVTLIFTAVFEKLASKTNTSFDDELIRMGKKPVYWGVVLGGLYLALSSLSFFTEYLSIIKTVTQIGFILILLIVSVRISRVFFMWASNGKNKKKKQIGFVITMQKIFNALIYFLALIFILQAVGISISPLVASLGIGGLAVGLALQPTLSNYFSGLYLAADGFLQPGDYIEVDQGLRGYVVAVEWRNTTIRLWNNSLVKIPNSKMADSNITNFEEPKNASSFMVYCGVGYGSDLKKVEKIVLEVANKTQSKKKHGVPDFEPLFRYYEFGDSNINFKVILQADKYVNHHLMKHEFIRDLKAAFDKADITIAFPTRTVEFASGINVNSNK
ncbi:mechanosensitive ion channel family protein [Patescibacteria group bacterium]|nr:mechanosensitive ion channel family protein [Patescibacteria group bacterium]